MMIPLPLRPPRLPRPATGAGGRPGLHILHLPVICDNNNSSYDPTNYNKTLNMNIDAGRLLNSPVV